MSLSEHDLFSIGRYILDVSFITSLTSNYGRSCWPRGLRRGFAAARLLGLWVRIPPEAWMSVCFECCQVDVSSTVRLLVQRIHTECGVS
jgi:hypothetical protein